MTLLQQSIQYIERLKQHPSYTTLKVEQARKLKKKQIDKLSSPLLQSVTDIAITVRDGAKIELRIYRPKTMRKLPVIVYYHGGGWVLNDINTSHESCIEIAHKTDHIVISVNYRLAPEHKFPTPLHDAFDAFEWVKNHLDSLHAIDQVSVAGDSAGGNLATVVALLAKESALTIESQLLIYPVTDVTFDRPSYEKYGTGYGLDREVMKWFAQHYVTTNEELKNPLISPLQSDVVGLPRTFIISVQYDVLKDEALSYAEKLQHAGVEVVYHEAKGLVHSYFTNNDLFNEQITETIQKMQHFLNKSTPQHASA